MTLEQIKELVGTAAGGDYVCAGSGTETLTEPTPSGRLDLSGVPTGGSGGAAVTVGNAGGSGQGTGTTPGNATAIAFSGFGSFVGTSQNDSFAVGRGLSATVKGNGGSDSLDASGLAGGGTLCMPIAGTARSAPAHPAPRRASSPPAPRPSVSRSRRRRRCSAAAPARWTSRTCRVAASPARGSA